MKRIRSENDEQRNEEEEDLNLLDYLPFDMIAQILTHLNVPDLLAFSLGCKAFYDVSQADRIWFPLCQNLWQGKQLYHNKMHKEEPSWKAAYVVSLLDSKRTLLTPEELCRFKWLFSWAVQEAMEATSVGEVVFFPAGKMMLKRPLTEIHHWRLSADTLILHHPPFVGHTTFAISRNIVDWGWNTGIFNNEFFQTVDPSLPTSQPLVLISTRISTYLSNGTFGKDRKTILLDPFDVAKIAIQDAGMSCSSDDSDYDSSYNEEEEAMKD